MANENPNSQEQKRPYNLLVVEDNPDDVKFCLRALQKMQADMGIEIRARANTDTIQAAAQLNSERFDAVFLDVNMPPPDGIELTRRIRSSTVNRTTPIVVITGAEDRGLMGRAFQAGANFFLFKPIDRRQLQRLIEVTRGWMERERRRSQRVRAACKVSIESDQGGAEGKTLDLSLGGMLVQCGRTFTAGSLLRLRLELLPAAPPIRLTARVMRVIGNDCIGLQFERLGKSESDKLGEFLIPLIVASTEGE